MAVRRVRPTDVPETVSRTEYGFPSPPGLALSPLHTRAHFDEATDLLCEIWGATGNAERNEVISTAMLRTLCHSGNYLTGAYRHGRLIGCSVGLFGAGSGRPDHLHSYITGVLQPETNRGVGFALKCHQRAWALERNIDTITWTFDPLVRRNGYFNLCKLGATAAAYEADFFGALDDGFNNDGRTDRLVAVWPLRSAWIERVTTAGDAGLRRHAVVTPEAELVTVPEDYATLRSTDPEKAQRERHETQQRFQALFAGGYSVTGLSRDNEYVLLPAGGTPHYE